MTTLFPFKPDYSDTVKDSFEWLTEVQQSHDGSEHRRQLREFPRRFVEYKLTLKGQDKQIFENLLAAKQSEALFLPLWHEKSTLSAQAVGGATTLSLDTTNRSFLNNGYAVVFTDKLNYEVVNITAKTDSSLTISPAIVNSWAANTAVYPLFLARLEESVKPSRRSSDVLQAILKFWLEENSQAAAVDFNDVYRIVPLLDTRNNWARQINSEYNRQLETIDFQVFGRFVDDQSNTPTVFLDYHFVLKTLAERRTFIEHLYALAGKWSPVWVPSGQHDFTLASPVTSGDDFITVRYCGVSEYGLSAPRQDIKITLKNGDTYLRRILYAGRVGDVEILTLDSAITANIAVSDVLIISYLMLMRLSADSVTIENHTGTIAECSVLWQSVNEKTAPDVLKFLVIAPMPLGGWYGGSLNTTEVWVVSSSVSIWTGYNSRLFKIDKTTMSGSQIAEFPDYLKISKEGDFWFGLRGSGAVEVRDLNYNVVFLAGLWNDVSGGFYDRTANTHYLTVNLGGAWVYLVKTPHPPTVGLGTWLYDADYPESTQMETFLKVVDDGAFVWCLSVHANTVAKLKKNPTTLVEEDLPGYRTVTTINLPVLTANVDASIGSEMAAAITNFFITLPLLGKLAKIDKLTGDVTEIDVPGLYYNNDDFGGYPTVCDYFPEIQRLTVSCQGDNTLKFFSNDGTLTHTFNTHAHPGRPFIVDNIIYVPCMGEAFTDRIIIF